MKSRKHGKPDGFAVSHLHIPTLNVYRVGDFNSAEEANYTRDSLSELKSSKILKDYEKYMVHPKDVPANGRVQQDVDNLVRFIIVYDGIADTVLDIYMVDTWAATMSIYLDLRFCFKGVKTILVRMGTVTAHSATYRALTRYMRELENRKCKALTELSTTMEPPASNPTSNTSLPESSQSSSLATEQQTLSLDTSKTRGPTNFMPSV